MEKFLKNENNSNGIIEDSRSDIDSVELNENDVKITVSSNDITYSREYDSSYVPSEDDIKSFPDLQNGPSSLIQGSAVAIHQVGIHNFRLPLKYKTRDGDSITLETKVTGSVSLAAHKKGINMSRIMRSFYEFKQDYVFENLHDILLKYKDNLESFNAKIGLNFSYPILKNSLRSENSGYQYYKVTLEGDIDKKEILVNIFILILFTLRHVLVHMNWLNMQEKIEIKQPYHIRKGLWLESPLNLRISFGLKIYKSYV